MLSERNNHVEDIMCVSDQVSALEEELTQAQSQAEQVHRERDLSIQQAEELDAQLCRLMVTHPLLLCTIVTFCI